MGTSKILIIDDNGHNGYWLGHSCLQLAKDWEVVWFRVTTGNPATPEDLSSAISYRVIDNQTEAADAIKELATNDLIVFYDVQLTGVQEDTDQASRSLISAVLKDFMDDSRRRMLVNVHSADKNSFFVAKTLDSSMQRVRYGDQVSRDSSEVGKVVAETLKHWNSLYLRQSLDPEQFISAMEQMNHQQIQDYREFLKERKAVEGSTEAELRKNYKDPSDVLMSYLGMETIEFEQNFCNASKALKGEVIEALKGISGLYLLDQQVNSGRPLRWGGAWLLALGVFRELQGRDRWKEVFNVNELGGEREGGQHKWPSMHAMQLPKRRAETVRLFARMTKVLFTRRGNPNESVLEKVELTAKKQPNRLSFRLSFPCVGVGDDQTESLLGRVVGHVDDALAVAHGRPVAGSGEDRDTSRAIWRFFLSASMCDSKVAVEKLGYGMAGGFSPMNIMSIESNTKTEVLWLN
jgi:hypothetical protein